MKDLKEPLNAGKNFANHLVMLCLACVHFVKDDLLSIL